MTDVLPFHLKPRPRPGSGAAPEVTVGTHLDVRLMKNGRVHRYWIHPGKTAGQWYGQVFYDRTQHRALIAYT